MTRTAIQKLKIIFISLFLLCAGSFIVLPYTVNGDSAIYDVSFSEEPVVRNSYVDIPDGSVQVDGVKYEMDKMVIFPDGREYATDRVYLDVVGDYTLKYSTKVFEQYYEKTFSFKVYTAPESLFSGAVREGNYDSPEYYHEYAIRQNHGQDYNGVLVTLDKINPVATFETPIKLTSLSMSELLLQYVVIPTTAGNSDVKGLKFTFTDIYNPDKFINLYIADGAAVSYPHWCTSQIHFEEYDVNYSSWDTYVQFGHIASTFSGPQHNQGNLYSLYYDENEGGMFAYPAFNKSGSHGFYDNLCSPSDIYNAFDGEFSGYVKLSVTYEYLLTNKVQILFTNVGGIDLSGDKLDENSALNISIDYKGLSENNLPFGVKGETNKYPIFPALVYNAYEGVIYEPDVHVYYGFFKKSVVINGDYFYTKDSGKYYIVYDYRDFVGGKYSKTIEITVKDEYGSAAPTLEFVPEMADSVVIGDTYLLYDPKVNSSNGAVEVKKTIYFNDTEIEYNSDDLIEYFVPQSFGTYKVEYMLTDLIGYKVKIVKNVVCALPVNGYVLQQTPIVPYAVKANENYTFMQVKADRYNSNKQYISSNVCDIYVENAKAVNGVWKPTREGDYAVYYKCGGQLLYETTVKVISVVNGVGFLTKFFVPSDSNGVINTGDSEIRLVVKENGKADFNFLNKIYAQNFSMAFWTRGNYSKVNIILSDANNKSEQVVLTLTNTSNGRYASINGKGNYAIINSYDGTGVNSFSFGISEDGVITYGENKTLCRITDYVNGMRFNGFDSDFVYLTYEIIGENGCFIVPDSIYGQSFSALSGRDGTPANIVFAEKSAMVSYVNIGTDIVCPVVKYIYDVLSNNTSCSLEIKSPKGESVYNGSPYTSINIKAEQYGTYSAVYTFSDSNESNKMARTINFIVKESNAPTIDVKSGYKTTCKVNETISVAEYSVSDDTTKSETIKTAVMVIEPYSAARWMVNDSTYTFTVKGNYIVRILAYDQYYNCTVFEYVVSVG